jgi:hypothetical protein
LVWGQGEKLNPLPETESRQKAAFPANSFSVLNKTAPEPYSEYQQDEDQKNDKSPIAETGSAGPAAIGYTTSSTKRHIGSLHSIPYRFD